MATGNSQAKACGRFCCCSGAICIYIYIYLQASATGCHPHPVIFSVNVPYSCCCQLVACLAHSKDSGRAPATSGSHIRNRWVWLPWPTPILRRRCRRSGAPRRSWGPWNGKPAGGQAGPSWAEGRAGPEGPSCELRWRSGRDEV